MIFIKDCSDDPSLLSPSLQLLFAKALCGPTRASFLTGTRPDTTRVWNIGPYFRDRMINGSGKAVITLPQYFKDYGGYWTVGSGKVCIMI